MPNPAPDHSVFISARKLARIGTGIRVWRAIGITFKGNGWHGDDRDFAQPLFQIVIFALAFGQAKPPAVITREFPLSTFGRPITYP
jgi:hypothetical protein